MRAFSWTSGAWVLAMTLGLAGVSWADPGGSGARAFVVNRDSGSVSVVSTATLEVMSNIEVGITPIALALTPSGDKAYVANFDSNEVSVVDMITLQATKPIPVGLNPKAIVVTPDGKRAYVANQGENSISIIDLTTDTVLNTLPANRSDPSVLALSPDSSVLYVLGSGDRFVTVVDTDTNLSTRIETGEDPLAVAFSLDGTLAYIANQGANTMSVFDTTTFPPIKLTDVAVGLAPRSVAVSPDDAKVYVANFLDSTISVINTATNQAASTLDDSSARTAPILERPIHVQATIVIPGAAGPWNILVVPSSTVPVFSSTGSSSAGPSNAATSAPTALVINRTSNNVGILNLSTDAAESIVEVGTNPEEGDFDPELPQAVVTNFGSNSISFFDTSGATASLSVTVEVAPVAVAVALLAVCPGCPVAEAGSNQSVRTLSRVTLDGTGSSDSEGDPLSYLWTQTEGPTVELSDPTSPTPSFRAPLQLKGSEVLSFELVVNDGQNDSRPDTVEVTVQGLRG